MRHWLTIPALLSLTAPAIAAPAPDMLAERAQDVVQVLLGEQEAPSVFADSFLAAVPPAQLTALIQKLEAQNGKLVGAREVVPQGIGSARFVLRFERAEADASMAVERTAPFKVTGFRIGAVTPLNDTPEKIAADFAALPGRSGYAVYRLAENAPTTVTAAHGDEAFAIGSTFKLWVLDALAEDIADGRHRWDEVVPLGPPSLPSGITQDWPKNAPVTVQTLATLMISMSDNTATDTLIRLVGRERIARRVRATFSSDPSRMLPLLTTADAFALKLSHPRQRDAYARADDAAQAKMLDTLPVATILRKEDAASLSAKPVAIDGIEWFASPADIAAVLDSLRRRDDPQVLQILGIAPGMAPELAERFAYVGYKGGSETGVINLSWLVRDKAHEGGNQWSVVTASWNDAAAAVDNKRFELLAQRLVRLVK